MSGKRTLIWLAAVGFAASSVGPVHANPDIEPAQPAGDIDDATVVPAQPSPSPRTSPPPRRRKRKRYRHDSWVNRDRQRSSSNETSFYKYLGLEAGANLNPGLDSPYSPGLGRGFAVGFMIGRFGGELVLGHHYVAESKLEGARAANTTGNASLLALAGRYVLPTRVLPLITSFGFASVSVPVLGTDGKSMSVSGLGVLAGAGTAFRIAGPLQLTIEVRGVLALYEIPERPYLDGASEDSMGVVTGTLSTGDISTIPLFTTIGVRAAF